MTQPATNLDSTRGAQRLPATRISRHVVSFVFAHGHERAGHPRPARGTDAGRVTRDDFNAWLRHIPRLLAAPTRSGCTATCIRSRPTKPLAPGASCRTRPHRTCPTV